VAFSGVAHASAIQDWQPFYNSVITAGDFTDAYASLSSIDFDEESTNVAAGCYYTQKVTFRFPKNDSRRSERIALMKKIKFVKLSFSDGLELLIGRNDYIQNARPKIKIKTNKMLCEVSIESKSITPAGHLQSAVLGIPNGIDEGQDEEDPA
jgi:hypothetical protein